MYCRWNSLQRLELKVRGLRSRPELTAAGTGPLVHGICLLLPVSQLVEVVLLVVEMRERQTEERREREKWK